MSRHTMPAADATWLHGDRPTNPLVVNGLVMLGEAPDPDRVAEALQRRLVDRFPRFRQRVVEPLGRAPAFEDDLVLRPREPSAPFGAPGSRRPGRAPGPGR